MELRGYHKHCKKCNRSQQITMFYKNRSRHDGLSLYCKKCDYVAMKKSRAKPDVRAKINERERSSDKESKIRRKEKYKKTQKYRDSIKNKVVCPKKQSAHNAVKYAIKTKKIIKPSRCEVCHANCIPVAHHDDYSKKLDVRFLCRQCHADYHRIKG